MCPVQLAFTMPNRKKGGEQPPKKKVAMLFHNIFIGFNPTVGVPRTCLEMTQHVCEMSGRMLFDAENFCKKESLVMGPAVSTLTQEEATEEALEYHDQVLAKTLLVFHDQLVGKQGYGDVVAIVSTFDNTDPAPTPQKIVVKQIRRTDDIMNLKDTDPEKWKTLPVIAAFAQKINMATPPA